MTKKDEKTNKVTTITDVIPEKELDDIFTELTKQKKNSKQSIFYLYWLFGFPVKTCADKANYAESYGYKLVEKYKKVPKLRRSVDEILNMFPERYRSVCKLRLPQIAEIEGKALDEYENKPKLAINKPALLKQVKQGAGVLTEEDRPVGTTININEVQKLMFQVIQERDLLPGVGAGLVSDAELLPTKED